MLLVLHGELTDTLSCSAQLSRIAEHRGQGHVRVYYEQTSLGLCVCDCAAAFDKLAHDIALVFHGHSHLHVHHGLENLWICRLVSFTERIPRCNLEGHGRRVNNVSLSISQNVAAAHDWVTSLWSLFGAFVESFFDGRDILIRYVISCCCVFKDT